MKAVGPRWSSETKFDPSSLIRMCKRINVPARILPMHRFQAGFVSAWLVTLGGAIADHACLRVNQ